MTGIANPGRLTIEERDRLAERFLPLAYYVVRQWAPRQFMRLREDYEDLVAAAAHGIVLASRSYDPASHPGASFKTHATWLARSKLTSAIREMKRRGFRGCPPEGARPTAKLAADYQGRAAEASASDEGLGHWGDADWARVLAPLSGQQRAVMLALYRDELSMHEAARRFGVCYTRVRQIRQDALQRLRGQPQVMELAA